MCLILIQREVHEWVFDCTEVDHNLGFWLKVSTIIIACSSNGETGCEVFVSLHRSAPDGDWFDNERYNSIFTHCGLMTSYGDRHPIGDWSAISRRLKTVSGLSTTAATGRRSVANQSATSRQLVGDHQQPFYDRFGRREVLLAATKTSLRPNRPCNHLQPVGDQSPTSLQPPCNLPATTRNLGRKEVADRLQAMCDRGLMGKQVAKYSCHYTGVLLMGIGLIMGVIIPHLLIVA